MLILAFDTASAVASVAVHDGATVIAEVTAERPMAHGESLGPAISQALRECGASIGDVTDIAVGIGPGPFTGLRIGIVTAVTLAETRNFGTHGVCSLDVLAAGVSCDTEFLVATDARRKEVYWARYDRAGQRLEGPAVVQPAELARTYPDLPAYGRGAHVYADVLAATAGPMDPEAGVLAEGVARAAFVEQELRPLYLRRPDARPRASV